MSWNSRARTRLIGLGAALAVPALVAATPSAAGAATAPATTASVTAAATTAAATAPVTAAAAPAARTTPEEARRVDRVPTPKPDWYDCYEYAQCATVKLPLDYDDPKGAQVEVAVLKVKARNAKKRIGSLFVNPGGPGGSATQLAYYAPYFLSDALLDRFDVVGIDPRGIGFSDQLRCFRSNGEQSRAYKGLSVSFPVTAAEEKAYVAGSTAVGKGCSTTGRRLASSMSTAEVARDHEVMRRAVGDKKLTYLGFSYGSLLGQYYANMFPDRFRALVVDGVVDPRTWVGTPATAERPQFDRIGSPAASWKALREMLRRCDAVGGTRCAFALGDPLANLELVAQRLLKKPAVVEDPFFGTVTITYADMVSTVLGTLYDPAGPDVLDDYLASLLLVTEPPATAATARATPAARAKAAKALAGQHRRLEAAARAPRLDFPYDNGYEGFLGVACTDGLHGRDAGSWPARADEADARAPYFGRPWAWNTSPCARSTWTAQDEDAYRGPFNRRTTAPVLVVGNHWDPATNYSNAARVSGLLPNSRFLSSDNWGHTAYGTSACATGTIDRYLLGSSVKRTTRCVGDVQPYTPSQAGAEAAGTLKVTPLSELPSNPARRPAPRVRSTDKALPPVAALVGAGR